MSASSSEVKVAGGAYNEESQSSRLSRKSKEAPFVPMGIGALVLAVAYGSWSYKRRGGMSTSVFLMQQRVIAQSMVVGAITIGVMYSIVSGLMEKKDGSK